jgi:hypothetical protein
MLKLLLIIVASFLLLINGLESKMANKTRSIKDQCELPSECKWLKKKEDWLTIETIACNNLHSRFNLNKCNISRNSNKSDIIETMLILKYRHNYILDNDFNMHKVIDYLKPRYESYIRFVDLKGLRSDLALDIKKRLTYFEFYDMPFDLYTKKGEVVKNCHQ